MVLQICPFSSVFHREIWAGCPPVDMPATFVMMRGVVRRIVVAVPTSTAPDEPAGGGPAGATAVEEVDADAADVPAGARATLPPATLQRFRDKDPDALGEVYDRYRRA